MKDRRKKDENPHGGGVMQESEKRQIFQDSNMKMKLRLLKQYEKRNFWPQNHVIWAQRTQKSWKKRPCEAPPPEKRKSHEKKRPCEALPPEKRQKWQSKNPPKIQKMQKRLLTDLRSGRNFACAKLPQKSRACQGLEALEPGFKGRFWDLLALLKNLRYSTNL